MMWQWDILRMGKFAFDNFSFLTLKKNAHLSAYLFIVEEAYGVPLCAYVGQQTTCAS